MGTSLPDTFASRTAALREDSADNSIGNITGSNSVNVFLGLGLPWLIAAIYHATQVKKKLESSIFLVNNDMYVICPILRRLRLL